MPRRADRQGAPVAVSPRLTWDTRQACLPAIAFTKRTRIIGISGATMATPTHSHEARLHKTNPDYSEYRAARTSLVGKYAHPTIPPCETKPFRDYSEYGAGDQSMRSPERAQRACRELVERPKDETNPFGPKVNYETNPFLSRRLVAAQPEARQGQDGCGLFGESSDTAKAGGQVEDSPRRICPRYDSPLRNACSVEALAKTKTHLGIIRRIERHGQGRWASMPTLRTACAKRTHLPKKAHK